MNGEAVASSAEAVASSAQAVASSAEAVASSAEAVAFETVRYSKDVDVLLIEQCFSHAGVEKSLLG